MSIIPNLSWINERGLGALAIETSLSSSDSFLKKLPAPYLITSWVSERKDVT